MGRGGKEGCWRVGSVIPTRAVSDATLTHNVRTCTHQVLVRVHPACTCIWAAPARGCLASPGIDWKEGPSFLLVCDESSISSRHLSGARHWDPTVRICC